MRRLRVLGLILVGGGLLAPVAAADSEPPADPTSVHAADWWRVHVRGGPGWQRKAVRWTGPDQATDLRGWVAGASVSHLHSFDPAVGPFPGWTLGVEVVLAEFSRDDFDPTPTLRVEDLTARQSVVLAVAGLEYDLPGRLGVWIEGGLGFMEVDVAIEYPPGGPPTTDLHETELAVRIAGGFDFGLPPRRTTGAPPPAWWERISVRVGFEWLYADRSTLKTAGGASLGGYRPDHLAWRFAVAWSF